MCACEAQAVSYRRKAVGVLSGLSHVLACSPSFFS